ncbi:MAG: (d)CMP kinase [Lachnospiraceae bacterium]|nr:(d)CMP kinase [Lachnospiraceae bacterium]
MNHNIAIDGPAGAGKSTIAKRIAEKLGYIYVDTGAMYRALGLHLLRSGIAADDTEAIIRASEDADITLSFEKGEQIVLLNGENVNGLIRTEEVGNMASACSVHAKVREKMVRRQQEMARTRDVVMDGRDICSVVLPDASVKVFLTASVAVRAKRRFDELTAKGIACDLSEIEADIRERDHRDMTREVTPLKQAPDATLVDSSDMAIDEVVDAIIGLR